MTKKSKISKCLIICSLTAFSAIAAGNALPGANPEVKVVKGQVSDYYINVEAEHTLTGTVRDWNGNALEGATVMPKFSPAHCNTDAGGHYALTVSDNDSVLCVYYPGMKAEKVRRNGEKTLDFVMQKDGHKSMPRTKAVATRWYNPENATSSTYCNPLNISYNYEPENANTKAGGAFRSSADPMGLTYKGEYYLFSTNQGGFHYSKNLSDWDFTTATFQRRPADDDVCAPAAYVSGDTLFYTGSTYEGLPVWWSTNPKSGRFQRAMERNTLPTWDPYLFLDDDGQLYEYYGSSNEFPLKGVRVSRDDFYPTSKIVNTVMLQPDRHGWERFGMNNDDEFTLKPFMEGSYMTKHDGKYYLQYGGPGTEFKIYADGVYVGENPLGPFTYQKHNPMSYKPGGFVQGAGHGGTFCDVKDNYWHVATCMLSLKYKFERRIGLYPTAFDSDGIMWCNTAFGDYPNWNAVSDIKNPQQRFTGWMLLSYGKKAEVSSCDSTFSASALTDENMRTYWAAKTANPGEWAEIDLGAVKTVKAIQLNYYDYKSIQHNRANDLYYQYKIYASSDGENWTLAVDKSNNDRDVPHDYVELLEPLSARYLKVVNLHMATGNFCLSEIRVFGNADGAKPAMVKKFSVKRDKKDQRNAMITWQPSAGAYGYNIYYGIAPDKMYNAITVNGATSYDMRGLDIGTTYYFTIEALGETGRSAVCKTIKQ